MMPLSVRIPRVLLSADTVLRPSPSTALHKSRTTLTTCVRDPSAPTAGGGSPAGVSSEEARAEGRWTRHNTPRSQEEGDR
eukprot:5333314-Pyramimonas_sp.AAC.1